MPESVPLETHDAEVVTQERTRSVRLKPKDPAKVGWWDIQVIFADDATVIVTGDAYDWVFKWHGSGDIVPEIQRFDEHYIAGKLVAASTRANAEDYNPKGTVDQLRDHYGEAENWSEFEEAARSAFDEREAREALYRIDGGEDAHDLVATKMSVQLRVAIGAVKMAAAHVRKTEDKGGQR